MTQLDVHAYVIRHAASEELRLLRGVEVPCMAQDGVEALGVILHRGDEGQASQLGEARAVERGPEAEGAQLPEPIPRRHALILLEGVVP